MILLYEIENNEREHKMNNFYKRQPMRMGFFLSVQFKDKHTN